MSGLEVAGAVLGSIPLVISALEHYADGVRTVRRMLTYKWELKTLILELETESITYRNTCEMLLDGIASSKEMEIMLAAPGGDAWDDPIIQNKLEKRLALAYKVYLERICAMEDAVNEFKDKLDLDDDGAILWMTTPDMSFKKAWKIGRFSLSKSSYEELVQRLREHNRALQGLTRQTSVLQSSRRKRSQGDRFKGLRNYAQSLYRAVKAMQCTCGVDKHMIAFISHQKAPGMWTETTCRIRPVEQQATTGAQNPTQISNRPVKKKVQWTTHPGLKQKSSSSSTLVPQASNNSSVVISQQQMTKVAIQSICAMFKENQLAVKSSNYIGSIADGSIEIDISLCRSYATKPESIYSFDDILQRKFPNTPAPRRIDKLSMSAALGNAILYLYKSPWVSSYFGSHDITLLDRKEAPSLFKQLFVLRDLSSEVITIEANKPSFIHNTTLFALGITLIEICFGQSIKQLRTAEDIAEAGNKGLYADYTTAVRLVKSGLLMEEAGMRYESVVKSCLYCNLDPRIRNYDLDDDAFRQAVYDNVVAHLDDELQDFSRPIA
ncbi:hypothetical protein BT63DRAFT_12680 [Microthyrium microscopicum]|uniref:DUF7580 domain-containing protein n=1 Tax=Microthyrium microscopicum TaxID=703497 RepID=A0A6A6USY1_9PEZI|nr:hypothetical protein BT63DRAFT_12680 [Microthyrium microscopicum]